MPCNAVQRCWVLLLHRCLVVYRSRECLRWVVDDLDVTNTGLRKWPLNTSVTAAVGFNLNDTLFETSYYTASTKNERVIQVIWTTFTSGERMCTLGDVPLAHNPCVSGSNLFLVPSPLSKEKLSLLCLSLIPVFNPIINQIKIC